VTVEVRAPREDDVSAVASFLDEHALVAYGESELDEDEVRHWLALPELWVRVVERDGSIAGYVDVLARDDGRRFDADARALERDAADALLVAAEDRARTGSAPGGLIRASAPDTDRALVDALLTAGWRVIRRSYRMAIALPDDLPEPRWPEGIAVRTFRPGEEERVYEAQMDAFADHWDFRRQTLEQWRALGVEHPRFDPSLWWLAEDGGEIAGLTLNSRHPSGDPESGCINVLGVRPPWRRRGLGLALLLHSFRDFAGQGANRVGLGVDAESTTGAVRLYERAGMRVVRCSDVYEKAL
jgi:mycothiol synthase